MTPQAKLEAEPCRCVTCPDCRGSGRWGGDVVDWEVCETCGGLGVVEVCDRCQLLEDMDHEAD